MAKRPVPQGKRESYKIPKGKGEIPAGFAESESTGQPNRAHARANERNETKRFPPTSSRVVFTSFSLRIYFGVASMSLGLHFEFTSVPFQKGFNFTSISLRFNFDLTSM